MIVMYFEATEFTCTLKIWFRELGFSISYGALLLKTWRISLVFRVRSATQVKITDTNLMKRLVIIVAFFVTFLALRTAIGRPTVTEGLSYFKFCHNSVCTNLFKLKSIIGWI